MNVLHLRPYMQGETPDLPEGVGPLSATSVPSEVLGMQTTVPALEELKKPKITQEQTIASTFSESVGARMLRGIQFLSIPSEDGFDPVKALKPRQGDFNEDELDFLLDSRSTDELHKRMFTIEESRTDAQNMAANPATAFAASLFDIDLVIGGTVGALGKASRLTRIATSVGVTLGSLKLASEGGIVTPLEATLWTIGAVAAGIPQVRKTTAGDKVADVVDNVADNVDDAARPLLETAEEGGEKVYNVIENAVELPKKEAPKIGEIIPVQTVEDEVPDVFVKDPDYPVKEPVKEPVQDTPVKYYQTPAGDTYISAPDGTIRLLMEPIPDGAVKVDSMDKLFTTVDNVVEDLPKGLDDVADAPVVHNNTKWDVLGNKTTTTRNAVAAILTLRKDLPEHLKVLATRLYHSLGMEPDIPIHFQSTLEYGDRNTLGYFVWDPEGPVHAVVRTFDKTSPDLDTLINNMSLDEIGTVLHESTHSKVDGTIGHVLAKTPGVPQHLKDAVHEISRTLEAIRTRYIKGALPVDVVLDGDFRYALTNEREFVASIFTAPKFVDFLRSVKAESLWKRITKAMAKIVLGKSVKNSGYDHLIEAVDTLLRENTYWSKNIDNHDWQMMIRNSQSSFMKRMPKSGTVISNHSTFMQAITKALSNFEAVAGYSDAAKNFAKKLLADATGTDANSAVHFARAALLQSGVARMRVQASIFQGMVRDGWNVYRRWRHPIEYRKAMQAFSAEIYDAIQENARKFGDGVPVTPHSNPRVQAVLDEFSNSRWAEDNLANLKAAGVSGANEVQGNPWYIPREHNYNKILEYLRNNTGVTMDDVIGMYTDQFMSIFADKGIEKATANKLAKQMIKNLQNRSMGMQDWRSGIAGMRIDDIREALEFAGVDPDQIKQFLGEVQVTGKESNKPKNLRQRLEFDMDRQYTTKDGSVITPGDFINKDVAAIMEGYDRRMAGRIGLAKAGWEDLRALDAEVSTVLNSVVEHDAGAAKELIDNNIKHILGMPTGERVPDLFRSINILSTGTLLGMSGVYQLGDTVLMMQEYGIIRTMRALAGSAFGRDALALARSPEYGKRLRDVLEGELVLQGMYRPMLTHLDDNFDIGHMSAFNQIVQHLGQNTRFASGLEFVRRAQVRAMAGLVADTMEAAIKGDAKSLKLLRRYGLTDDLLSKIKLAKASSDDVSTWGADVMLDTQAMLVNAVDAVVLENHLGDIAPWMQFSTLGKVILPYLSFVSGAWNKILRRRGKMDGLAGVMMAMAYQMPASALATVGSMALKGKELDEKEIAIRSIVQTPIMSWFGYALDFATQGPANSVAALSIADKMYTATKGVLRGDPDPQEIINAMPWISIIPGMKLYGAVVGESDTKTKKRKQEE